MMPASPSRKEYLRLTRWMQVFALVLLIVVLVLAITDVVSDWSDWVVLGGIIIAVVGFAIAIQNRQYPTKKRAFTRDRHSDW
jgi:protein-S-isoprenylcysteine O-methyltransferase Ste14